MNLNRIPVTERQKKSVTCHGLHDGIHAAAVSLPHGTEARLASNVPKLRMALNLIHMVTQMVRYLDGDIALGDFSHVETHSWNHVFAELSRLDSIGITSCNDYSTRYEYRNDVDKCGLPRVLQPDEGEFHFFFPEETLEPFFKCAVANKFLDKTYHKQTLPTILVKTENIVAALQGGDAESDKHMNHITEASTKKDFHKTRATKSQETYSSRSCTASIWAKCCF
jgi:hypothetical protein